MLEREATWLGERLRTFESDAGPVLNVGSSSAAFRESTQPWIDELVFRPLRARGVVVTHQDFVQSDGVDLVGDLCSREVLGEVRKLGIRSVICSNVLEHVPDPRVFAQALLEVVPDGGRLLITVPRVFPYHPDPLDTLFRPTPDELLGLFPGTAVCASAVLKCGRLHDLVLGNPGRVATRGKEALAGLASRLGPRATPRARAADESGGGVRALLPFLPHVVRPFEVTCLDLRRVVAH